MAKRGGKQFGPLHIVSAEPVPLIVTQPDGTELLSLTDAGVLSAGASIDASGNIIDDLLLATNKKIQFRDSGIFIQSGADGKLTIQADGSGADDITLAGTVTISGLATLAGLLSALSMPLTARTATADGTGTGTVADGSGFVEVTSASVNNIIVLPTPTPGTIVMLHVGATGYELRSDTPATVAINGGAEANAESAIPAGSFVFAVCVSATAWLAFQIASDGTTAGVAAAAAA